MAAIRLRTLHVLGEFAGIMFIKPAAMHYVFNAEYADLVRVGERITVTGKGIANYLL